VIRRPGDTSKEPEGDHAAERLRMFERARSPKGAEKDQPEKDQLKKTPQDSKPSQDPSKRGADSNAGKSRRED
jgi:hypothetical protein